MYLNRCGNQSVRLYWVLSRNCTAPLIAYYAQKENDYSRRVISWAISNRMKRDLAIHALDMAVTLRKPPEGCIHHSDRGSKYCSHDCQKRLRQHGFKISMSGKGNSYDNAVVETFFKTIKAKRIWKHSRHTRRDAELAIFEYINGFYNPRRRHSLLGWKNPLAFERIAA